MNTPSARSARMKPMVKVPISRLMMRRSSLGHRDGGEPACAADEFALLRAGGLAVVGEEMENALEGFGFEEGSYRTFQIDRAFGQGAVRKSGGVKVAGQIGG